MTLCLGLLLQLVSLGMLVVAFGRSLFRRIGTYFVLSGVIYHGVTEVWQRVTRSPSVYRLVTTNQYIDRWTVIVGTALVLFSAGYIAAVHTGPDAPVAAADVRQVVSTLNWRILAVLCVPLIAVVGTSAYNSTSQFGAIGAPTSALVGLARQFLILALAITTVSYIVERGRNFLLPILVQLGATALIGSRLEVLAAALTTLFALAVLQRLPAWRKILTSLVVVLVLTASIGAVRAHVGRQGFSDASIAGRVSLIVKGVGLSLKGSPTVDQSQGQPIGARIDGNSFAAGILEAQANGVPPVGLTTVRNDLALAVPSFLAPGKLSTDVDSRSEKAYIANRYSILFINDFLPTQLGTMLSYYGPIGLLVIAALMGVAMGAAERFLRRRLTPSRLVLLLTLFLSVASYENSMDVYPIDFRGGVVLMLVVFVTDQARRTLATRAIRKSWSREPTAEFARRSIGQH